MQLSPELKSFIREHASDDTDRLLLQASRYPGIDVPFAVNQILARRRIKDKLPSWYAREELIFPSPISAEQCSSEHTALYKQKLLKGESLCDLTGGLGADCSCLARKARSTVYVERLPEYCEAARHNFAVLQIPSVRTVNADVREILPSLQADTFYIDPARRDKDNKRTFALTACEPDILELKPLLLKNARRLIVKISPMADLEETLRLLPETCEIHILSVKNECKELLFLLENGPEANPEEKTAIYAVELPENAETPPFAFRLQEEKNAPLQLADSVGKCLYEPNAAMLKSGAFKLIAVRYGLQKLHRHSHLYTSSEYVANFPGRCFVVEEILEFSGKLLKQLNRQIPRANLATRNFPLSVAELRKRSGIKDGGEIYLFATTLSDNQKVIVRTRKVNPADFSNNE